MSNIPYILHPMEVASVIGTLTSDEDVLIAGLLHDTVEDCGVDPCEIREKFGPRVSALVQSETENRHAELPQEESWKIRKEESLRALHDTKDTNVRILWLGDKLSNMRSIAREYAKCGNEVFAGLHQTDPKMHEWYYRSIAEGLSELSDTAAYREFVTLIETVFGNGDK
ncbi:MAG: HD domain-containing protein [Clostridia bacterium]|nr:HD domain-containing protein [Clostridia bacterium]